MKPPYSLNPKILELVAGISQQLGIIEASFLSKPSPTLRKQNRIQTIHASLRIEGNKLATDQVTALLEQKRVLGPARDILEVKNAIQTYEQLPHFEASSSNSFLEAHRMLMQGLVDDPGQWRTQEVGIAKGSEVKHVAPPPGNVRYLMQDLFSYLKEDHDLLLIKSCVFHYEMEFIHPFMDGNGRMGRLWQSVILMQEFPVFEFLPLETLIAADQESYYTALAKSDAKGESTPFLEYMLGMIKQALETVLQTKGKTMDQQARLEHFLTLGKQSFTRKDYMTVFRSIGSATASRDLKQGVAQGLFTVHGLRNQTIYKIESNQ